MATRGPKIRKEENAALPRGIYKRGDIYWIRYGHNGRDVRESTFGSDLKKAENLLILRKADVLAGKRPEIYIDGKKNTFADLVDRYENEVSKKKKSYSTEKHMLPYLKEWFGSLKLHKDFSKKQAELLQQLVQERERDNMPTQRAKPQTANRWVAIFKNMFTYAHDELRWINKAVLDDIRTVKMFSEAVPDVTPLTSEECIQLIKRAPAHIRIAIVIGIYTGLRRKDILNLKWSNINFDTGVISLVVSKTESTKKTKELLHISLGANLRAFLENTEQISEYVVCKPDGTQFKTFKESWAKAKAAIGKPKLRLPDLRHTFASMLAMEGVPLYTISLLLGHSTMEMTKRYAHLLPNHTIQETKKMDSIINISSEDMKEMYGNVKYIDDLELEIQKKKQQQEQKAG
jgi:integrase